MIIRYLARIDRELSGLHGLHGSDGVFAGVLRMQQLADLIPTVLVLFVVLVGVM